MAEIQGQANEQQKSIENKEKLTPEQQKKDILEKSIQIVLQRVNILGKGLEKNGNPNDPEYAEVKDHLEKLKNEFNSLNNQGDGFIKYEEHEKIFNQNMSNIDFLGLPEKDRLQHVTRNNVDYADIKNGNISEVTFFFDQDGNGKDDGDLYKLTTAGQVFGKEVGNVRVGGKDYIRNGLDGEFFNGTKRLTIHTDTVVQIDSIRTSEDIQSIESGINEKLENYSENQDIAKKALEKGINPEFAIVLLKEKLPNLSDKDKGIQIENILTNIARIQGKFGLSISGDKYDNETASKLLYSLDSKNYEVNAKKYGIPEEEIVVIKETFKNLDSGNIDLNNLSKGVNGLLETISKAEGTNGNYNAIYGNGGQDSIKYTDMTIREVLENQEERRNNGGQSATGKYQFIYKTLKSIVKNNNINIDSQKFTPEFQDKIAIMKLNEKGLNSYKTGDMDQKTFQFNLSKEWASLPKDSSGDSYYKGDSIGNHSRISDSQIDGVLDNIA